MPKHINTNIDDDEEEDILKLFGKTSKIVTRTLLQAEHVYRIDYEIQTFEQSEDLARLLLTVPSGDAVRIFINSIGGRVDIADWLVNRIKEAQDRGVVVIGELGFTVASAATYIALACDDLVVSPHTEFMIHNWSGGSWGTASQSLRDALFNKSRSDRFMRDTYKGFLDDEEIEDLIAHPIDLSLTGQEVVDRWNKLLDGEESSDMPAFSLDQLIEDKINDILAQRDQEATKVVKKVLKKGK